jgi:beta-xylosidase
MRSALLSALSLLAAVGSTSPLVVPATSPNPALMARATTFNNPGLWQDYPDLDVFRVGDVFYYSSSTFAFSPGAPVLKSYDLVNWTPVSHSVPRLNFGSRYDLNSATDRAYVKGIWASELALKKAC